MRALVPLAEGVEEMEAVITIDVLRRAEWDVVAAGLTKAPVRASRGVRLLPDASWDEVNPDDFDLIALPGGNGGVERLCEHEGVLETVRRFDREGKWIASVCAGVLVLQAAGILEGRRITGHPSVRDRLTAAPWRDERVVVDGRLITSQGPGTCFAYALTLVGEVDGREKADAIARAMVVRGPPGGQQDGPPTT